MMLQHYYDTVTNKRPCCSIHNFELYLKHECCTHENNIIIKHCGAYMLCIVYIPC